MIPHMKKNDINLFYKYLDQATNYFEYGSGGSTYQASIRNNIKTIFSIESDLEWHNKMINKTKNVSFIYNPMDTAPNNWGHPGPNSTPEQKKNYSNYIKLASNVDLILIDGRFRVACCLKCYDVIKNNCFIAFDDFLNRSHYHVVLDFFEIVDKTDDNCLVILKKKSNVDNIKLQKLILQYELNSA